MNDSRVNELRELPIEALSDELLSLSRQLLGYRLQRTGGHLTKTHLLKSTKRDIARVQTIISERKREEAVRSDTSNEEEK